MSKSKNPKPTGDTEPKIVYLRGEHVDYLLGVLLDEMKSTSFSSVPEKILAVELIKKLRGRNSPSKKEME